MDNNIFSKNGGGASDTTLRKKDSTWIFISSKFHNDDNKKSINSKFNVFNFISVN